MPHFQRDFDIRCEWGEAGATEVAAEADSCVIVDVLSFSTCVDVALSRGAVVYPYRYRDATASEFAISKGAVLAGSRRTDGYSLSPVSLQSLPADSSLVLPSPNGATLSCAARGQTIIAGCLRNARAVAGYLQRVGGAVTLVPAGERWPDGSLRPAIEDLIGAGAIISELPGRRSPEAQVAEAAFQAVASRLMQVLLDSASGRELTQHGFPEDVRIAGQLNVSDVVPVFRNDAYRSL